MLCLCIGSTNQYLDVTSESTNIIVCNFLEPWSSQSGKSCNIKYGICQRPFTMTAQGTSESDSLTTIKINLGTDAQSDFSRYCFTLNATNDKFTLLMKGNLGK